MGFGYDLIWNIFPVVFLMMFVLIFGAVIVAVVQGIASWNKNNHSPRLDVSATVVTKRTCVHHHRHHHAGQSHISHTTTSTSYYVTFQVESGDRLEFSVNGHEYGMLAEGDDGKLAFQGTRFLSFERF